jgi:hypothetical protein
MAISEHYSPRPERDLISQLYTRQIGTCPNDGSREPTRARTTGKQRQRRESSCIVAEESAHPASRR